MVAIASTVRSAGLEGDRLASPSERPGQRGEPVVMFDGKTLDGWKTFSGEPVTRGWVVQDGAIVRESRGGHIYFEHGATDYEFSFEWKIAPRGNSGVKYRVGRYGKKLLGCEYQILDDRNRSFTRGSAGALYAMYEPGKGKRVNPAGEWNTARIVVQGNRLQHWLNGKMIVDAVVGSDDWNERLRKSKFMPHTDFAREETGRIMLQDHGSKVWYRKLKLVPFSTEAARADQPPENEPG
jgi:hypothetical protein